MLSTTQRPIVSPCNKISIVSGEGIIEGLVVIVVVLLHRNVVVVVGSSPMDVIDMVVTSSSSELIHSHTTTGVCLRVCSTCGDPESIFLELEPRTVSS